MHASRPTDVDTQQLTSVTWHKCNDQVSWSSCASSCTLLTTC